MTKHQIITTERGEELVVLSRADFEELIAAAAEAEEDAADVAAFDAAMRDRETDAEPVLTPLENATFLIRNGLIRSARKQLGMSQEELAEAAGVTQAFISEVEAGRKRGTDVTMRAIAEALRMPPIQLGVTDASAG